MESKTFTFDLTNITSHQNHGDFFLVPTFFWSRMTEVHFFSSNPAYFLSISPGMSASRLKASNASLYPLLMRYSPMALFSSSRCRWESTIFITFDYDPPTRMRSDGCYGPRPCLEPGSLEGNEEEWAGRGDSENGMSMVLNGVRSLDRGSEWIVEQTSRMSNMAGMSREFAFLWMSKIWRRD